MKAHGGPCVVLVVGETYMFNQSAIRRVILTESDDVLKVGLTDEVYVIDGGNGNDRITTSYGNDLVFGGTGNDFIESQGGDDILLGGDGDDVISFGTYNDPHTYGAWIVGGEGSNMLLSYSGHNFLIGGSNQDYLVDYSGTSILYGGAGENTLMGTGRDVLIGGPNSDLFQAVAMWGQYGRPLVDLSVFGFRIAEGDRIDLSQLGWFDERTGIVSVAQSDLSIQGNDLWVMHPDGSHDTVEGVGVELELVGLQYAIEWGYLQLQSYGGKG